MAGDKKGARRGAWIAALVVATLVGLAGAGMYLPTYSFGPALQTPDTVISGAGLYGSASDDSPPIRVTALLDGVQELEYSPDLSTDEEGVNHFCFPVPSGAGGHFIIVEARNDSGYSTQHVVSVVEP